MADTLTEIFRAASKHPNSRVSKLIHQVEEEPTQKNIVLLLIELSEHAEYSIDFNVSLKYYLNLFERCGINNDLVLNEAGLLLVNSSKIYSKRVDYVQSLVERQILTLSNADDELQKQKLEQEQNEHATPADKPKRGRKRALEAPSDPFEVELAPKKFKKLTEEKRFALTKVATKAKTISRNIEMEQQIHPAGWQHAVIYDLENEEDVDTKRNYKLFTYHVEHRYNTLVPDINFRLHFKVKDYMDEQEEMEENEACNTDRTWPPLSEAYVQKYLRLENYVLEQDVKGSKRKAAGQEGQKERPAKNAYIEPANASQLNVCSINESLVSQNITKPSMLECNLANVSISLDKDLANKTQDLLESSDTEKNDSGLGQSILDESNNTLQNTQLDCTLETSQIKENLSDGNILISQVENDSALGSSILEQSSTEEKIVENVTNLDTKNKENQTDPNVEKSDECFSNAIENETPLPIETKDHTSNIENITTTDKRGYPELPPASTCETIILNKDISEESTKARDNRKDSALDDDRFYSISTENLAMSSENLAMPKETLSIDVIEQQDKNSTQIHMHLPSADDEGVCLSDLEDHDYRLLSPIIKATNILPGVERKNITIVMDDELIQALEMRDGILKHFGNETFTVPVITEPRKQNLVFNILQLPEKLLRRKILFKLGPDMELFLQARCLKRSRQDPVARAGRNFQLLKWFSLNNTDMTGICMTPPQSPGHLSDFCGFSNNEDDNMSCADFCGFTEEEQLTLKTMPLSRLSRDSGVGVDVNNLTSDREPLEIRFEKGNSLKKNNCKEDLSSNDVETETTEGILEQLPKEIRDALTLELTENSENNVTTSEENKEATNNINSNSTLTSNNTEETEKLAAELKTDRSADTMQINTESTENLPQSNTVNESENNSENCSFTKTQETDAVSTEKSSEIVTSTEQMNCETLTTTESQEEPSENDVLVNDANNDDDFMLDLNSQGNKTKIQQWHEHLQPILAKSRERHHFDIYQLGTEIINTVQSKTTSTVEHFDEFQNNCTASFEDIMEDKDKSYVSRYFLSTLLLTNQSNIEISINNKSSENPSAWQDIHLKLLSTKRHTVDIEDNIGMIDNSKQKAKVKNVKQNSKEVRKNPENKKQDKRQSECDEDEDEPLIKLQRTADNSKTHFKRNTEYATLSCIAEKKTKEVLLATSTPSNNLPYLIESVQIINPSHAPLAVDTSVLASTSNQAHQRNLPAFNFNMNTIRTLQPIEKVQNRSDDHDSGIFSVDEISTS